jgi:hypothetical protein
VITLDLRIAVFSSKYLIGASVAGLTISLIALGIAPAFMPNSYSWVTHTTSESAAQGVEFAWIARLGFVAFGGAVALISITTWRIWNPLARIAHAVFGMLMVATAIFSHRPWDPGVPFNQTEDLLHSIAATGMGFAFAIGVVAVMLSRRKASGYLRMLNVLALVASVAIPLAMLNLPEYHGLFQRGMFLIAYVWYGTGLISLTRAAS